MKISYILPKARGSLPHFGGSTGGEESIILVSEDSTYKEILKLISTYMCCQIGNTLKKHGEWGVGSGEWGKNVFLLYVGIAPRAIVRGSDIAPFSTRPKKRGIEHELA
ncbi:MAG: hypothetical protein DSM106950_07750 [Stigonema ocellatum SAG 48.90 = DSM 106950]|nr:hypothetical protein [Stigonema ocellatum SAG 48.90 = DSM 106950]